MKHKGYLFKVEVGHRGQLIMSYKDGDDPAHIFVVSEDDVPLVRKALKGWRKRSDERVQDDQARQVPGGEPGEG